MLCVWELPLLARVVLSPREEGRLAAFCCPNLVCTPLTRADVAQSPCRVLGKSCTAVTFRVG